MNLEDLARRVYLGETCRHCGRDVRRHLSYSQRNVGDYGDEIICTQVADRCDGGHVLRDFEVANYLALLPGVFDNFRDHVLTRELFDQAVRDALCRHGGKWEVKAS